MQVNVILATLERWLDLTASLLWIKNERAEGLLQGTLSKSIYATSTTKRRSSNGPFDQYLLRSSRLHELDVVFTAIGIMNRIYMQVHPH